MSLHHKCKGTCDAINMETACNADGQRRQKCINYHDVMYKMRLTTAMKCNRATTAYGLIEGSQNRVFPTYLMMMKHDHNRNEIQLGQPPHFA